MARSTPWPRQHREVEPDFYVVHTIPNQRRVKYDTFKGAYELFKIWCRHNKSGSAALWRGPKWDKLYTTGLYPETLTEPFGPLESYK